ncbi:MAG: DUF3307 domain-containing protein [Fervidobacterium sp.]|uniref:DUF3307 domain-containing protein n=1 Tax=Fervidobacterium sp. TaxID=1871331 RepID=UPI00404991A9
MSVLDIFPYLLFGHLFGDYVLQTGYIAAKKSKDIKVLGIHIVLILVSQLVFVFGKGFGVKEFIVIAMLSGIHFLIDLIKFHCKTVFCNSWKYYLIDQSFHLSSLIFVATFLDKVVPFLPRTVVSIGAVMIFNAYFIGILSHLIARNGTYKRDYIGYFMRMVAPVTYFISLWSFLIYALLCGYLISKKRSMFNLLNYVFTIISTVILLEVML